MKKTGLYISAIIGAVALYFFSKSQAVKSVKVYFDSLSIGKLKGFKIPDLIAKFRIVNPTNTPLSVRAIAGDIFVNGKQIASFNQVENLEIPANNEVIYSVDIKPDNLGVILSVISFLKKKQKIKIEYTGTVNSSGVTLPISDTVYQN